MPLAVPCRKNVKDIQLIMLLDSVTLMTRDVTAILHKIHATNTVVICFIILDCEISVVF